jgi:flagellar biosynthesis/type III secretory pathway M-ring protein FliF/YscJ
MPHNQPWNHMNHKHWLVALGLFLSITLSAWAEPQEPPKNPSFIESLIWIWSVLPFIVISAFIWFFFVKGFRNLQEKSLKPMEAQKQLTQVLRIEFTSSSRAVSPQIARIRSAFNL